MMYELMVEEGSAKPEYFEATKPVELVYQFPAVKYSSGPDRHFRRLAHLLIPDCQEGDILTISAQIEVSNKTGQLMELAAGLVLTPDSSGTAGLETMGSLSSGAEPSGGKFITMFPGYNITPVPGGMHHGMMPLNAIYKIPAGISGDQYIAFMAYAASQEYWPTSKYAQVKPWCGWLQVTRTR